MSGISVTRRSIATTCLWTLIWLVALDLAINAAFPYPTNPREIPGKMPLYFDYGRSIESKIRRMVGPTDESSSLLALAGWLDQQQREEIAAPPGNLGITVYGMSFSHQIVQAMLDEYPSITPTYFGGPAAPPNHSYSCFVAQNNAGRDKNSVQILGILASAVKGMLTLGGATTTFEGPTPFTYPRYLLDPSGKLVEIPPSFQSLDGLRAALNSGEKWSDYIDSLRQYDRFYDPYQMLESQSDRSAILRMVRRSYAQHESRRRAAEVAGPEGFHDHPEIGPVLRAMVIDFARRCREGGRIPLVLLINDRPYRDGLFRLLEPTLDAKNIPYVSTHVIAPTTDSSNFLGDGHFTPSANRRIGHEALRVLRAAMGNSMKFPD